MPEESVIRSITMSGGISTQRPEVRSLGQVEDANNVDFDLKHGCSIRAGTAHLAALGTSIATGTWMKRIVVDSEYKPTIIVGSDGTVRVFDDSGTEYTVHVEKGSAGYIVGDASTEGKRPMCAGTSTVSRIKRGVVRFAHPGVVPVFTASGQPVSVTAEHRNFDTLASHTPALGTYHRVLESTTADHPAGLYRYTPGAATPAVIKGSEFDSTASGFTLIAFINGAAQNPMGAIFRFGELVFNNTTAGNYNSATRTLTITGQFAKWSFTPGRKLFVSGPGGVTIGDYEIESRVSDDAIILKTNPTGATTVLDCRGIGISCEVSKNFTEDPASDIYDFAFKLQQAIRDAGATNACLWWSPTGQAGDKKGYFYLSNHFCGALAGFPTGTHAVRAPAAGIFSLLTASWPFNTYTSSSSGNGDDIGLDPADRWTMIAVPGQSDAVPNPLTMPITIRKVFPTTYNETIPQLNPVSWWSLRERVGTMAADRAGIWHGTYTNSPTLSASGCVFDGTNDYVSIAGTIEFYEAIRPSTNGTYTVAARIASTAGNQGTVFFIKDMIEIRVNHDASSGGLSNGIVSVRCGNQWYKSASIASLNSGTANDLVVSVEGLLGAPKLYYNGTNYAMTSTGSGGTAPSFTAFVGNIGSGDGANYFQGTIADVFVLPSKVDAAFVAWYKLLRNLDIPGPGIQYPGPFCIVTPEKWKPRTTGDAMNNPVPSFVKNRTGITALARWQTRLSIGAGRYATMSVAGEEASLFVNDASIVTDAAPIDREVIADGASKIRSLVPFGSICYATTDGPKQYEISSNGPLTIGNINSRSGLHRRTLDTDPVLMADRLYLASTGDGENGGATLLELSIDEQSVQISADDVGQHIHGLIDSSTPTLVSIPDDGKVLVVGSGTENVWTYEAAWVGGEKRQSAFGRWTLGGTIKAACESEDGVLFLVQRGSNYVVEVWKPASPDGWPIDSQRMDGRVRVASVSQAGGTTTFTMPTNVPATGITTVVKDDGVILTATPISATQFTVQGMIHPMTVTAGRSYQAWIELGRSFTRDLNGIAYVGRNMDLSSIVITATDVGLVSCGVTVDSRPESVFPFAQINFEKKLGRAWTRGPSGRTRTRIIFSGPTPASVGTVEQFVDNSAMRN